jgi:hypothetical protein
VHLGLSAKSHSGYYQDRKENQHRHVSNDHERSLSHDRTNYDQHGQAKHQCRKRCADDAEGAVKAKMSGRDEQGLTEENQKP